MKNIDFSLIVPCYNEQDNIEHFFEEAEKTFHDSGISYEYVFVNDGSSDHTESILKNLFDSNPLSQITIINFSRNFGKESAIYAGLKNCCGDAVCLIDADLQQRPETALEMYRILKSDDSLECVCAYQRIRKESKFMCGAKSLFYKLINIACDVPFKNGASDFRVFDYRVKDAIISMPEYHRFSKGIFSWVGFNTYYYEYEADERNAGETKWSFTKLLKYAVSGMIAFSTAPLVFAAYLGGLSTLFSVVYFIVTLVRYFTSNIKVDGFTQQVILISFFGGTILFTLGIIGEYIAKIYQQVKSRPVYIAKDIIKREE